MEEKINTDWFKEGKKFYCHNEILNHVVNVFVIDNGHKLVVYRFWSKVRQRWYFKADYARLISIWACKNKQDEQKATN